MEGGHEGMERRDGSVRRERRMEGTMKRELEGMERRDGSAEEWDVDYERGWRL